MTTPQRYERLCRLFAATCELTPPEQVKVLQRDCADDPSLWSDVEGLLARDVDPESFLDRPALGSDFDLQAGQRPAGLDAALPVGDTLGGYRIVRELGGGGQGVVYLADDVRLGRRVALKVLSPALGVSERLIQRFKREAEAAARIDHPGVCAVHDAGVDRGHSYIAMNYVEGETLAEKIARSAHDGAAARRARSDLMPMVHLVEQAARAVHAAHEEGVIHRDLKPANIMITPDGRPVVLDFGLARDEQSALALTVSGDLFGTPPYMAPEQIQPQLGRPDRRTDVYALGATLYECLTLRRPFEAPTREGLYRAILSTDLVDPRVHNPAITRDLKVILETALAKEPDDRYQTAEDLAEDLRRVRQLQPILARPASPLSRLGHWARRSPGLAATLTGIVLTLGAGLAATSSLLRATQSSLAETKRLTDLRSLNYLQHVASDELWPVLPETVSRMDRWLDEAEALYGRRGDFVATDTDDLSGFAATIEQVRIRRDNAASIADRTIDSRRADWDAAIEAIADERKNPHYSGLRIEPQVGLVPIGQDPDSRLFEFAHLQTGSVPARDPATGRFVLTEGSGLVFVLIPGGTFRMGADRPTDERPFGSANVDPGRLSDEAPVHTVELDAFFLSKYEMTQAQWLRATGTNPSRWSPGSDAHGTITSLHPVENVNQEPAVEVLKRFGLVLPTEAQWEYAARAGTTTIWWTGDDRESLRGAVNLADQAAARAGADWPHIAEWPDLDDGYVEHAPVGTFRANPFGLHEVHGNVWELVRDVYGSYDNPVHAGDGERQVAESGVRVSRGGGFYESIFDARSARRYQRRSRQPAWSLGLRPGREVSNNDGSRAGAKP